MSHQCVRNVSPKHPAGRILLILCVLLSKQLCAFGQIDQTQYRDDLEAIAKEPRAVGSIGYFHAASYIENQIRQLPNVELRRQQFPVMVPVTRSATLTLPNNPNFTAPQAVYPFWPAGIRLNATPAEGIKGRPIYVGRARYEEIRPAELKGQIAVVEASAGPYWDNAAYFGAKAILILGSPDTNNAELRFHDLTVPVNLPRFYIPPGQLADALRSGSITQEVTLKAAVNWERKTAVNVYALIRARSLTPPRWEDKNPPGALMISVPMDASGLVPDLVIGASHAAQTAGGLAMVRALSKEPLDRPVVVFFSGADSIAMLGTRKMFLALSDLPSDWDNELKELATKQAQITADQKRLREVAGEPWKINATKDRKQIDRIVTLIETDLASEQDELFRLRREIAEQGTPPTNLQREQDLSRRQVSLNQLRYSFMQRPEALQGELSAQAKLYVQRAIEQLEGAEGKTGLIAQFAERERELNERVSLYAWLSNRLGKTRSPDDRSNQNRLIELLIALDLTDGGVRCGPMYWGRFLGLSNISQIQDYRDWLSRSERNFKEAKPGSEWWGSVQNLIDLEPLNAARTPASFLCAPSAVASELCQAWGVPGFSMVTLDDLRLRRDTPTDLLANLKVDKIVAQLEAVQTVLWHAWDDPKFIGQPDLKWQRTGFTGQVVTTAAGRPVPDLPQNNYLVTYWSVPDMTSKIPKVKPLPWTMGVRRNEVVVTDAEGNYRIEGIARLGDPNLAWALAAEAFKVTPNTGIITGATDLGRQAADIKFYIDLKTDLEPWRCVVFPCEEITLCGIYDPRFLQSLGELILLDARRNAEPQRFNAILAERMFAGFVEPGARNHFLFRYGRVGNRLILINKDEDLTSRAADRERTEGRGFSSEELKKIGPLALATSRDFWNLDDELLGDYRKAGVFSSLIDDLHGKAKDQISDARAAEKTNDGAAMMKAANGAWANSARVYSASQDMANDVIRGAIFLLLLCVPFSFCMERLIVGTPNIYKQIAGAFTIFALMTAALWSFHPAFKISSSPLIIILAFAIIFMSVSVMFVVYGKFDTELKRIQSGKVIGLAGAGETNFARASVLSSAILLGIANMRRRKFRTVLTSVTIILITFAVLCFTSSSRYLDTTTLPTGTASTHPGLMLRQRGWRPMPIGVVDNIRPLVGGKRVVERWWVSSFDPKDQVNVIAQDPGGKPRTFAAQAMLGLSPGESEVSPELASVIGETKLAKLEKPDARIVFISKEVAQQLKVQEGSHVRIGGIDLEVASIFDGDDFDRRVKMLSGDPIAPLRYQPGELDAGGRAMTDTAVESFDLDASGAGAEMGNVYEHLPSSQFVIVPASVAKLLPFGTLRSVAVRAADGLPTEQSDTLVKSYADELSRRFAIAMFAGFSDGVRMVSASNLSSVSGAGQVAIPLAIAGLIIFNTMMGSIAERKREIHIYTSLGLAPMHVGALFVAEAMTYGLIGAVFGYVIGQGVGTALLHLGWLGNVTLNYSGTSAITTMGLILLIVLLSALVPARLASQLAAPSIERSWKVPLPKGDEILAIMPFTINKTAADGALAYLVEYFDAHREGSIGKFSAGDIETFAFTNEKGAGRGLKTIVWLTPFDLGVRQHLTLIIHPGEFPEIYEVQLILHRLSGDDRSWYRMNKTFLTEVRKQFLQWRSLSPQRMMAYVRESAKLFNSGAEETFSVLSEQVEL
jgi:ABC-type antimicrobial peptide transport system permease subunit